MADALHLDQNDLLPDERVILRTWRNQFGIHPDVEKLLNNLCIVRQRVRFFEKELKEARDENEMLMREDYWSTRAKTAETRLKDICKYFRSIVDMWKDPGEGKYSSFIIIIITRHFIEDWKHQIDVAEGKKLVDPLAGTFDSIAVRNKRDRRS